MITNDLILVCGPPGIGKSTFCNPLSPTSVYRCERGIALDQPPYAVHIMGCTFFYEIVGGMGLQKCRTNTNTIS